MAKEQSVVIKICDWVIKFSVYIAVFLIPILFFPWTADVLDFNKQAVLVLLGFVGLFAWMLKVLAVGKMEFNKSKIHITVGVLFLAYLLATIFSIYRYASFWGWPQSSAESLLTLIGLILVYFLISNYLSKKNIFTAVFVFSFSALVAQIVGILQLFGLFVKFNTVGSIGALGFFCAILLPFFIALLIVSKKWWKALFIVQIILCAIIFFAINYPIVWWAVIAGSAMVVIFGVLKRNLFDGRWMALPMFFLAISLFFVLLNPQIPWISRGGNEIFISQNASLQIGLQAIKERPIFGSGLGTFAYDFSKFKNPSFSSSPVWSASFNTGASEILSNLSATGVVGFLALLALIILPLFFGIKFLIKEKVSKQDSAVEKEIFKTNWILTLGVASALFVLAVVSFLYNFNIVLGFVFFFMLSCLVVMIDKEKQTYDLKPSSMLTLGTTFAFTLLFIFGLGILILGGQRYVAEINYYKGLTLWQAGNKTAGTKSLEKAASLNSSSDLYFTQLSQAYLANLQDELQNAKATPTDVEKSKIQTLIANVVNSAKIATDLNPKNVNDWSNRGYVYQSLNGLIADSSTWALNSYAEALKLDPNNPYLLLQQANINFANKSFADAKSQLEKAVSLNQNYSNALYSLGLVYDALGDKAKAIQEFTKVGQLNPKDQTIPKILANLNAGLPALQQPTPQPATPPTDNSSPTPAPKTK